MESLDGLRVKDREPVRQFISDSGWNDKRDFTPDWILYLAVLMVSQGWKKGKHK